MSGPRTVLGLVRAAARCGNEYARMVLNRRRRRIGVMAALLCEDDGDPGTRASDLETVAEQAGRPSDWMLDYLAEIDSESRRCARLKKSRNGHLVQS